MGLPARLGDWPPGGVTLGSDLERTKVKLLDLLDVLMVQIVAVGTQSRGLMFPYKTLGWSYPSHGVMSRCCL